MVLKTNLLKITFTKNNIFLNLKIDKKKNFTLSSGFVGFEGSQRFTKDAFKRLIKLIFRVLKKKNITDLILILKGLAFFFDLKKMVKTFQIKGIKLNKVLHVGFLPHNGCRSSKKQRLKKLSNFILP
jgi:ribosomal protein S11